MILGLRRRQEQPRMIYDRVVAQAREPAFYCAFGVADSLEGRFELLVVHVWLALRRLKGEGARGRALAQEVVDLFFADMDESLRELGVGDQTVPKKVRRMAEAFYGRVRAYDAALAAGGGDLSPALARNIWGGEERAAEAAPLAAYVERAVKAIGDLPSAGLFAGRLEFPLPQTEDA